ncbi:membrane-spanning 4-domains subfamily A member 15-like [Ambystoma mexicanum]|uniref:membrane-spanning 4-domains subfamily A member 15-like n=1 Tax=Ambystoma mexicanum TaxID=8296 RepID=UPI0037E8B3AA
MASDYRNITLDVGSQKSPSTVQTDPTKPSQTSWMMQRFNKGRPKELGVVQIMIGLAHLGLGCLLMCLSFKAFLVSRYAYGGLPFLGSAFFTASGAMSIVAEIKGTERLVNASVSFNISSVITAFIHLIIALVDIGCHVVVIVPHVNLCPSTNNENCLLYRDSLMAVWQGIMGLIVIFLLLEIAVAFTTVAYGCKAVYQCCTSLQKTQPLEE